jgi:hypothetical protein
MSITALVKNNLALAVGLTLPTLVMVGFIAASGLSDGYVDPPKYSLVFSVPDYSPGAQGIPLVPKLVVKNGALRVQYTRVLSQPGGFVSGGWRRLYLYDAAKRTVRELPLEVPANPETITGMREEAVAAAEGLALDTTLQAPDGYQLAGGGRSRNGLVEELFWRRSDWNEPRLRRQGATVRLFPPGESPLSGQQPEFVGWVAKATR